MIRQPEEHTPVNGKRIETDSQPQAACRFIACCGLVILLVGIAGCRKPAVNSIPSPSRETHLTSREDFSRYCQGCHGADGKGGPAPILNDPIFLTVIPEQTFFNIVAHGRPGNLMPAWAEDRGGPLTREQIQDLTRSMRDWWGNPDLDKSSIPQYSVPTAQGGGVVGDTAAGKETFEKVCGLCHGLEGRGGNAGALRSAAFLALASHELIRRTMIVGRPDLGMPNFRVLGVMSPPRRPLTSREISDVLAYMLSWPAASLLKTGPATQEALEP